jgi:hypothetical protein
MDLYSMQLNETMWINSNRTEVLRVAGGWIYRVFDSQTQRECVSQCFVPFNNEFQSDKPADRPEGEDYRTKYESLRSQIGEVVKEIGELYQHGEMPSATMIRAINKLDKLAKGE